METEPWLTISQIASRLGKSEHAIEDALSRIRREPLKFSKLCRNCRTYSIVQEETEKVCTSCGFAYQPLTTQPLISFSAPRLNSTPLEYQRDELRNLQKNRIFHFTSTINVLLNKRHALQDRIKSIVVEFSKDRGWSEDKSESLTNLALKYANERNDCYGKYEKLTLIHIAVAYALSQHKWGVIELTRFADIWTMLMSIIKRKRSLNQSEK